MTWLAGRNYRRSHVIAHAANAGAGYQIKIIVHQGNGTTVDNTNEIYCNGKCKSDFGDIRFTKSDGVYELPYWLESIENGTAVFWVKMEDSLSSVDQSIFVYYDDTTTDSTTSNGAATFDFFDDFSSSPNGWSLVNSAISGGQLDLSNVSYPDYAHAYKNRPSGYDNYRFRFAEKTATTNMGWRAYARERGTPPDNTPEISGYDYYYNPISQVKFITQGSVSTSPTLTPARDNNWHKIELTKYNSAYNFIWDTSTAACTDGTAETGTSIAFCNIWSTNAHLYIDWVFMAKFVSPEPAHGDWGEIETPWDDLVVGNLTINGETVVNHQKMQIQTYAPIITVTTSSDGMEPFLWSDANNDPSVGGKLQFYDLNSGNYASLFEAVVSNGVNGAPALAITHHLVCRKDFTLRGMVDCYEGALVLHNGSKADGNKRCGWAPSYNPFIWLKDSTYNTLEIVKSVSGEWKYADIAFNAAYVGAQIANDKCLDIGYNASQNLAYMQLHGDSPYTGLTIANEGTLYAGHGIYPSTGASVKDCGNATLKWNNIWAVTVHQGDAVFANGWRLTEDPQENAMLLVRPDGSIAQKWR